MNICSMRILLSLVLLSIAISGFSQTERSEFYKSYKTGSTLYVWARSGLNLRSKQDMNGAVLGRVTFGEAVTVVADANAVVPLTYDNIRGEWVKVKWKDKEGYLFNGYLSRYGVMVADEASPHDGMITYLKKVFRTKSDTETPPDNRTYNIYRKIVFQNGVELEWLAPEGGSAMDVTFPAGVITFQEMYLLARAAYTSFFTAPNKCDYKEGKMSCTDQYEASLDLSKTNGKYLLSWGHAD
jgi:hypothetical protein